jgi:beta-galactosidase GanA
MRVCYKNVVSSLLPAVMLVLAAVPATAQLKQAHQPFLFGATWDDPMSPAAKQLFLESGCNYARLSGGGFGWSLAMHRTELEELRGHGIYTMLQLGSHWPDGSYSSHSEDFLVDQNGNSGTVANGIVSYSGEQWPQYSYASPEFRARLEKDFTVYLNALASDPSVVQLMLHNEPGYHWIDGRVFDYNPKAIAAFRQWLPTQYGDVAALNASWGTHYSAFSAVDPPKELPPVTNIAAWMDWRRFNADLIENFLTWEEQFAKKLCPNLPSTTNLPGPLDNWYPLRLSDIYRYTQPFDSAAIDIYAGDWTNRYYVGYAMDMARGAAGDRTITVAECDPYDASENPKLSSRQLADRLRSDLWRYIGHGAGAILMWTWGSPGGADVTTGEFNDRVAAVREIAHLTKMLDLGDFTSPHRSIALVADQDAFVYYDGLGSNRDGAMRCEASLQGLYDALAASGLDVDIISADQVRSGVPARYRALVMATPAIMDDKLTKSLAAFVNRDGAVIAEAPFAQFDRWGKPIPTNVNTLQKLFGVTEEQPYDDGNTAAVTALGFAGKGRTQIRLAGANALASFGDGSPAVTEMSRGRGKAILIASDVGVLNEDNAQPGLGRFLLSTIERNADVMPTTAVAGDSYLDTSLLRDEHGNRLIVITNPTDKRDAPTGHKDVSIVLRGQAPDTGNQLFVIEPSRTEAGRTSAGPRLASLPPSLNGVTRFHLATVDSASVLMIVRDHAALLAIDGPSQSAAGSTLQLRVTCYNPSPRAIAGTIGVDLPPGWRLVDAAKPVKVPARGEMAVDLLLSVGPVTGRSVVKATFAERATQVVSVPIDVMVTGHEVGN